MTEETWPDVHRLPIRVWRDALNLSDAWSRLPGGEDSVVVADASRVIKLVPPFYRSGADREISVLRRISLPVATPRLDDVATIDGWTAIHMSRLAGRPANEAWGDLDAAGRSRVMQQIGEVLVEVARTPIGADDGDATAMMARLRDRAKRHPVSPEALVVPNEPAAFVHFDLNTGNAMLDGDRLVGVLDFVVSRAFYAPFDAVTPAVFFARGDRGLLRVLLSAMGLLDRPPEQMAAWHLLHPFSEIDRDLGMAGRSAGPDPLGAMIDLWRVD